MASCLQEVLKRSAEYIFRYIMPLKWKDSSVISWLSICELRKHSDHPIYFHMICVNGRWRIDQYQLEAILGLWMWSLKMTYNNQENSTLFNQKSVGFSSLVLSIHELLYTHNSVETRHISDKMASQARPNVNSFNADRLFHLSLCTFHREEGNGIGRRNREVVRSELWSLYFHNQDADMPRVWQMMPRYALLLNYIYFCGFLQQSIPHHEATQSLMADIQIRDEQRLLMHHLGGECREHRPPVFCRLPA
jgi:hypothetical protein